MATFDEQFFVHEASPLKRVWRDIRLLGFFATIVWRWLWQGGSVRRRYRQAEALGQVYYLDRHKGVGKYGR
jgi:hypothetical protein